MLSSGANRNPFLANPMIVLLTRLEIRNVSSYFFFPIIKNIVYAAVSDFTVCYKKIFYM